MSTKNHSRSALSVSRILEPRFVTDRSPQSIALERLGQEIVELSADLQAAEYRFLCLIREFDEGGGWVYQGARSCAQWLSWRTGLDGGAAREKVRVAKALRNLPLLSEALSGGEISYSKVRAVTRVATVENEETLLQIALQATAYQVERMARAWRKANPSEESKTMMERRTSRPFSMRLDEDGMWVVRGRLTPEVGAILMEALQAAGAPLSEDEEEKDVSAETSLPAETLSHKQEEAPGPRAESALASGRDLVKAAAEIREDVSSGRSMLEPSSGVSAETSRRVASGPNVVEKPNDENRRVLEIGRNRRILPLQNGDCQYWGRPEAWRNLSPPGETPPMDVRRSSW